ncbi:hypothetical protein LAWI1_G005850 [Lachnellula willkommii]|uniref:DUF6594 domain-containing protein n=1 Tax=Lachnellula willkommii TaxID=215461 RepID=A0A559M4E1_9HELO|nr:hypothetical protein LAWI1_G005850 [Lachnellula willkommii]
MSQRKVKPFRVLLEKQDHLVELENKLHQCDDAETVRLNLASRRQDSNQERRQILQQIETALGSYDRAVLVYHNMLALPQAQTQHRQSLEDWVNGNKPLVRSESTCFVGSLKDEDYVTLRPDEPDTAGLEALLEMSLKAFPKLFKHISHTQKILAKTNDMNIVLFPPQVLRRIVKIVVGLLIPLWLILPTVLLYNAPKPQTRAIIASTFTFGTCFIIIEITRTTKYNLILAVVSYGAVLSAFISGSLSGDSSTNSAMS